MNIKTTHTKPHIRDFPVVVRRKDTVYAVITSKIIVVEAEPRKQLQEIIYRKKIIWLSRTSFHSVVKQSTLLITSFPILYTVCQ